MKIFSLINKEKLYKMFNLMFQLTLIHPVSYRQAWKYKIVCSTTENSSGSAVVEAILKFGWKKGVTKPDTYKEACEL